MCSRYARKFSVDAQYISACRGKRGIGIIVRARSHPSGILITRNFVMCIVHPMTPHQPHSIERTSVVNDSSGSSSATTIATDHCRPFERHNDEYFFGFFRALVLFLQKTILCCVFGQTVEHIHLLCCLRSRIPTCSRGGGGEG